MNLNIKCEDFDHRLSLPKKAEKSLSPSPQPFTARKGMDTSLAKKRQSLEKAKIVKEYSAKVVQKTRTQRNNQ